MLRDGAQHYRSDWIKLRGAGQKLAGHADIKTTLGYVHVAGNDLHDAVDAAFG